MPQLVQRLWRYVGRRISRARRRWHRVSEADIVAALGELIGGRVPVLLMHSSLSACGSIPGGGPTVIRIVERYCDTLCLPTNTYCYPTPQSPTPPTFDPRSTPSLVGQITNDFWRQPGVVRSIHPTHAFAARGPMAEELCRGHELCDTPCGPGTPYAKLLTLDAAVLMFGANMSAYTLFHTAEDAAAVPYLYEAQPYTLFARDHSDVVRTVVMRRQDMSYTRRFAEIDKPLEQAGVLKRRKLGLGELLYIPSAQAVHAFLMDRLRAEPYYLVQR